MQGREIFLLQAVPRECRVGSQFTSGYWTVELWETPHSLQQGLRYLARNQVWGGPLRVQRAVPQTLGIKVAERGVEVRTAQFSSLSLARHTASLCSAFSMSSPGT